MHEAPPVIGSAQQRQRVAVTGGGLVLPAARGEHGFLAIDLEILRLLGPERGRRLDPLSQLGLVAVDGARRRAQLDNSGPSEKRVKEGIAVGSALGATTTAVRYAQRLLRAGAAATNPIDFPDSIDGAPAAHVALDLGLGGPSLTFTDGEHSATAALAFAARQIAGGRAERMYVVVGDRLDVPFARALAIDPSFTRGVGGEERVVAECVFALVLERGTEPEIEVTGFLDSAAAADPAPSDEGAPLVWHSNGERIRVATGPSAASRQLRDPSGALVLAGAWLAIAGPTTFFGGPIEPGEPYGVARRVRCGATNQSHLAFVRSSPP